MLKTIKNTLFWYSIAIEVCWRYWTTLEKKIFFCMKIHHGLGITIPDLTFDSVFVECWISDGAFYSHPRLEKKSGEKSAVKYFRCKKWKHYSSHRQKKLIENKGTRGAARGKHLEGHRPTENRHWRYAVLRIIPLKFDYLMLTKNINIQCTNHS